MKTPLIQKATFLTLILIGFIAACSPASDAQATNALREFYKSYIQESSKFPMDAGKIASLKQKHCTSRFLKTLEDAELDADPFLNAQDVDAKWADNLEIVADDSGKNVYQVCFGSAQHCVKATMVEEGKDWKIDQVAY